MKNERGVCVTTYKLVISIFDLVFDSNGIAVIRNLFCKTIIVPNVNTVRYKNESGVQLRILLQILVKHILFK